jgi:hypothetical protein
MRKDVILGSPHNPKFLCAEVRAHLGVETQRQWSDKAILRTAAAITHLAFYAGFPAAISASAVATFRRKIDVFGSAVNGLRPSKDRRAAGGHF